MAYEKISAEREGDVAVITLNDPAALNALDEQMVLDLIDAFSWAAQETRCVLLTGAGRAFCAGANLASGAIGGGERPDAGLVLERAYNPFASKLRDLPIPIVNAVNGVAAGAGASIALMGDIIVAGESAYFLQAFRRIGLVPDASATYVLPRMVGRARAMEMMLLGEKLPAPKALEWGLINRCVADAEVMSTARALAQELAAGPTRTLGMIRKLAWQSLDTEWAGQLRAERETQREAGYTNDCAEGVAAFLQKRPAKFTGS